jgi:glycosyltransferase involved in cell wall biosynthesis
MYTAKNLISVVIPLYNKQSHILATIQTVLDQTAQPLEIIVVDDGSSDKGAELVSAQLATHPAYQRVRLIRQVNGGVARARNVGIAAASSDFVALIDADDIWETHFLEEIDKLIGRFPQAGGFATGYQKMLSVSRFADPKVRFLTAITEPTILPCYFEICARGDLPFMASSICINKTQVTDGPWFPEGEAMGEDQDLWARLSLNSSIAFSPKVLAFYRLDAENRACKRNYPSVECGFSRRLDQALKAGRIPISRRASVLTYTATHLLHLARLNISIGRFQVAEKLLSDRRCNRLRVKKTLCQARIWLGLLAGQGQPD